MTTPTTRFSNLILSTAVLGTALLGGCASSDTYQPPAKPTMLSAYAASLQYPGSTPAQDNPSLTSVVDRGSGAITIRNFGSTSYSNFNLWVNQTFVLHVDHIEPNSKKIFLPEDLYNSAGHSLAETAPDQIHRVQLQTSDGKLTNVQGPQLSE